MKKETGTRAEHDLVQSYYRIITEMQELKKDCNVEPTSEAAATLAAAAVIHDQMEYHGDAIKSELAGISELLSKD